MLYIRTDMNEIVATGHVMRCLAIADAAREIGRDTTFILADRQAVGLIRERGYHSIVLNTKWNDLNTELDVLQKVIEEREISALLLDSYMVTQNYMQALSNQVAVIYIDDLNAFTYPVHTLICYANYWEKFKYEERYKETKLLLGLRYAPLRKTFINCKKKDIKPRIENLLLLSGGTDNFHILKGLLEKIGRKKYKNIDVICGKYYAEYELLCGQYRQFGNIHLHKAINNIEDYMMQADVAVSAGGTTLYELCACGTPTISYSFADNQLDNVMQFQKENIMDYAGDIRNDDVFENVNRILEEYDRRPKEREARSRKMQALIDGNGSKRIAEELIRLSLEKLKVM